MDLFDVLFAKKLSGGGSPFPPVIKRVTGNPIEFEDGADAPLVKCTTAIQGNQDLHGYDKPWVGGAGKNKLPLVLADIKSLNTTGTWSGNNYAVNGVTFSIITDNGGNITGVEVNGTASASALLYFKKTPDLLDNTYYVLNGCPSNGSTNTYALSYSNNSNIAYSDIGLGVDIQKFDYTTYPNSSVYIVIYSGYTANNLLFKPMIRLATETDSTFSPYSNICPITAYDEGEIEVRGKNLLNPNSAISYGAGSSTYSVSGNAINVITSGQYSGIVFDKELPNGTYNILFSFKFNNSGTASVTVMDEDNTASLWTTGEFSSDTTRSGNFTVTHGIAHIRFYCTRSNASGNVTISNLMLNTGSSSENYEEFRGTTHTTTYPSAIYRGSEDVVKGEVTSNMPVIDLGDLSWYKGNRNIDDTGYVFYAIMSSPAAKSQYNAISMAYNLRRISIWEYMHRGEFTFANYDTNVVVVCDEYATTADLKMALDGVMMAYELATPTTSSITPTNLPIKSLFGYNHIESSTGEMTIDYITDAYQEFADTTERAIPSTRKSGLKAFDIFKTLDEPKTPEAPAKESKPEEKGTEEGAKR